ncbi:MAG: DUF190 domain-containing protein [Micrococcales bacterium]|nr:DUF190 domain-containing protein [Micrococcales bacterium]
MTTGGLRLSVYFGERQRIGRRFLADDLMDLFGRAQIATSILMRGISGFGLRNHLRTDQLLTLSEDPPLVAAAVDTAPRVEAIVDEVAALGHRGLMSIERVRLVDGETGRIELPSTMEEATKLAIYVGRHERVQQAPAYVAICALLRRLGVAGASAFLGVDGTMHGQRERARFFEGNADVPTMIIAVGPGERMRQVLAELEGLVERPLVTVERVRVCKRDGELITRPHELPDHDAHGLELWQKLTVYGSEAYRRDGHPLHRQLVRELRAQRASRGATVLRGVWGFHGDHEPHGDHLLQVGRRVPVMSIVLDTPSRMAAIFDVVDRLTTHHGLVTVEMVPAVEFFGADEGVGGRRMADHDF